MKPARKCIICLKPFPIHGDKFLMGVDKALIRRKNSRTCSTECSKILRRISKDLYCRMNYLTRVVDRLTKKIEDEKKENNKSSL